MGLVVPGRLPRPRLIPASPVVAPLKARTRLALGGLVGTLLFYGVLLGAGTFGYWGLSQVTSGPAPDRQVMIVVPELAKEPVRVPAPEGGNPAQDRGPNIVVIGPRLQGVNSEVVQVSGYAVVEEIAMAEEGATSREIFARESGDRFKVRFPSDDGVVSVTTPDGQRVDLDLIAFALEHGSTQHILENSEGPLRAKIILTVMKLQRSPDGEYKLNSLTGVIALGREAGQ